MRDIKFRGIQTENKKQIYGNLLKTFDGKAFISEGNNYGINKDLYAQTFIEAEGRKVFQDTIGQFTGLKDKNGKEIYEGDIVTDGVINYIVAFYKGAWRLKQNIDGDTWWKSLYRYVANFRVEVIGNVYENPEFLQEDK